MVGDDLKLLSTEIIYEVSNWPRAGGREPEIKEFGIHTSVPLEEVHQSQNSSAGNGGFHPQRFLSQVMVALPAAAYVEPVV